ncbi:MAG: 4Fe-4S double cluster binding domain-containing protein [Eubacteriales bacterium]
MSIISIQNDLKQFLLNLGVTDVGFARIVDGDFGDLQYAVSVVVKLSDAVIEEIDIAPTHTYFYHYRSVNAFIDRILLDAGIFLEKAGYKYIPVAASQSINDRGWNFNARYSHKKVACLAGLGSVGKNSLFLHNTYGARVRMGTLVTDCPFETEPTTTTSPCKNCNLCTLACPAKAITGKEWTLNTPREELFLPGKCSEYMKTAFNNIGRGAVCGICISVCPFSNGKKNLSVIYGDRSIK